MRLWQKDIVKSLPELQLRSQWRELVAIAKGLYETGGFTNHLLINQIMNYDINHFVAYVHIVYEALLERGFYPTMQSVTKLKEYVGFNPNKKVIIECVYKDWHTKEYLRSNMANLWEKHFMGVGKSRITDEEWQRLLDGYKHITGEEYHI